MIHDFHVRDFWLRTTCSMKCLNEDFDDPLRFEIAYFANVCKYEVIGDDFHIISVILSLMSIE